MEGDILGLGLIFVAALTTILILNFRAKFSLPWLLLGILLVVLMISLIFPRVSYRWGQYTGDPVIILLVLSTCAGLAVAFVHARISILLVLMAVLISLEPIGNNYNSLIQEKSYIGHSEHSKWRNAFVARAFHSSISKHFQDDLNNSYPAGWVDLSDKHIRITSRCKYKTELSKQTTAWHSWFTHLYPRQYSATGGGLWYAGGRLADTLHLIEIRECKD